MMTKYRQLAGLLKEELSAGRLPKGRLPSERELCRQYQVSRQTVRQALALLEQEELIEKRRGSGSYAAGRTGGALAFLRPTDGEDPSFWEIRSACEAQNYSIQYCPTRGSVWEERRILERLIEIPVRGICVEGTMPLFPNPNVDLYRKLMDEGVSLVFLGSPYRGLEGVVSVSMDNMAGGYLAVRRLMALGHTRFACLFRQGSQQGLERYGGCIFAARDYGLTLQRDCCLWLPGQGVNEGCAAAEQDYERGLLRAAAARFADRCGAAVCQDYRSASELAGQLRREGVEVPGRFRILFFEEEALWREETDLEFLVCTGQPPARVCVDCLLRMLAGKTVLPVRLSWEAARMQA